MQQINILNLIRWYRKRKLIILPLNSMDDPTKHDQYTSDTLPAVGCDWLLETFYIGFEGVF